MRQKYILEIYDKLINEIKYDEKTSISEIIDYLKNCSKHSHYLYKIKFSKKQGIIKYTCQKKVHNLHPYAPDFANSECETNPEFEKLVPIILKELNIPDSNLEFCWKDKNEKNIMVIKESCNLQDVPYENLHFLYCYHIVKNENRKIKGALNQTFFNLRKEEEIELYVHRKQFAIDNLSKSLIEVINPSNPSDIYSFSSDYNKIDCLKIIHLYLEKLLVFIEKEYRNFLNVNIHVPYRTLLVNERKIVDKLNFIKSRLLDCNINNNLLKLAYEPLLKIATIDIQEKITYNEFNYCCEYIKELYIHFQQNKEDIMESDIDEWLFDLNLNSLKYFNYKTNEILFKLNAIESDIDKIDTLYQILKGYNQRPRQSGIKFNKKLASIKEQVVGWIEEEIEYLSKKKDLGMINSPNSRNSEAKIKIQTNLSVADITFFFKILMITKMIIHKNNAEIFRFIADNFNTKSSTQISADSVKNNFYNSDTNSKLRIRPYIIELLNLTK